MKILIVVSRWEILTSTSRKAEIGISPYSVRMQGNTDSEISKYGQFSRSQYLKRTGCLTDDNKIKPEGMLGYGFHTATTYGDVPPHQVMLKWSDVICY